MMEKEHSAWSAASALWWGDHVGHEIATSEVSAAWSGLVTQSHETLGSTLWANEHSTHKR